LRREIGRMVASSISVKRVSSASRGTSSPGLPEEQVRLIVVPSTATKAVACTLSKASCGMNAPRNAAAHGTSTASSQPLGKGDIAPVADKHLQADARQVAQGVYRTTSN
jgi:hypothetical protein